MTRLNANDMTVRDGVSHQYVIARTGRPVVLKDLTEEDVGKSVIYIPLSGMAELGIISSWNDLYVFVRYSSGDTAAATSATQLFFPAQDKSPGPL